jgi:hypothetical protein
MKLSILLLINATQVASAFQNGGHRMTFGKGVQSPKKTTKTFSVNEQQQQQQQQQHHTNLFMSEQLEEDPIAELSDERKANLFQSLLRDLQIEDVPLLGCDATAVHTMSAALWTTMAELSENDEDSKVCLVMEAIPVGALKAFEEDFTILKTQGRLMAYLPELKRISVSLIGKGVGPAFIIETQARTAEDIAEKNARNAAGDFDEAKSTDALKSFIDRVVVNEQACPYTKNIDLAAVGLENKGVTPGPVAYRFDKSSDACSVVGAFWTW